MKTSAVTSLLKYYPLAAALETIAEAGYEGVELWGGFPHAYVYDMMQEGKLNEAILRNLRNMIDASGLERAAFLPEQVFYPINFLVTDTPPFEAEPLRARSMMYYRDVIRLCGALEIPRMLMVTQFWGWEQQDGKWQFTREKNLPLVIDMYGQLAAHAEKNGVTLVLEPLTHLETTSVETLDDLLAVLDGVNSPALAAMLDTGHVNVTCNEVGKGSKDYWREHITKLGDRLQHIHVDDNMGDLDAHLLPGEGTFDFADGFAALKEGGYDHFISAELMMFGENPVPPKPLELLRTTRDYLRGVM